MLFDKSIYFFCANFFQLQQPTLTQCFAFFLFFFHIALLAGTLRTYQKAGCDAEYMALNCPRGTQISIELAQYGNMLKGIQTNLFCMCYCYLSRIFLRFCLRFFLFVFVLLLVCISCLI